MRREGGYTLLELLVVLMIMALLVAAIPGVALPVVTSMRFSGKVQEVAARLAAAHDRAIETGRTVEVAASNLQDEDMVLISPRVHPVIAFYADGSASANIVTIQWRRRRGVLGVDQTDGRLWLESK